MNKELFRKLLASVIEKAESLDEALNMLSVLSTMSIYGDVKPYHKWYRTMCYGDVRNMLKSLYDEVDRYGGIDNE